MAKKHERLMEIEGEIHWHESVMQNISLTEEDKREQTPKYHQVQEHAKLIDELMDEQERLNIHL